MVKQSESDQSKEIPDTSRSANVERAASEAEKSTRAFVQVQKADLDLQKDPNRVEKRAASRLLGRVEISDEKEGIIHVKGVLSDAAEAKQASSGDKAHLQGERAEKSSYSKDDIKAAAGGTIEQAGDFCKSLAVYSADGRLDADATSKLRAQAAIEIVGTRETTTNKDVHWYSVGKLAINTAHNKFLRDNGDPADNGWMMHGGKCWELGHAVGEILEKAGEKDVHVIMVADPKNDVSNHCFTVMNIGEGADVRNPKTWGPKAICPDAWGADVSEKKVVVGAKEIANDKFRGRPVVYHNGAYLSGQAVKPFEHS